MLQKVVCLFAIQL